MLFFCVCVVLPGVCGYVLFIERCERERECGWLVGCFSCRARAL